MKKIIFIGEQTSKKKCWITRKPSFYDAILLSQQSPQPVKASPYQSIPLKNNTHISVHFSDYNIQFTYQEHTLQISKSDRRLTEEDAIDLFNHFAFQEGRTVAFLGQFPNRKSCLRKRRKARVLSEEKELEGSEFNRRKGP